MIAPGYAHLMARYSMWQNESLLAAADTLDDAARRLDRGAFFRSITRTFSHILWADLIWMARFEGIEGPAGEIAGSPDLFPDWEPFKHKRRQMDRRILGWAERLDEEEVSRDLQWHSAITGQEMSRPLPALIVHFFNHQTHHRGHIHAMLTAAGARPGDTDLFLMPEEIGA